MPNQPDPHTHLTCRNALAAGALGAAALTVTTPPASAGPSSQERRRNRIRTTASGASLYSVVQGYSRWSSHRTGSTGEAASLRWIERELRAVGARTGRWSYDYPHYEWSAQVRVGNRPVPTVPLYYKGVGHLRYPTPYVQAVRASGAGADHAISDAVAAAAAAGATDAVLPVTKPVPGGTPYDENLVASTATRTPSTSGAASRPLLIPGRYADEATTERTSRHLDARIRQGHAYDLTGWLGTSGRVPDPIVVTTPLSGWFTCAGERGTGLAFALALAADLAEQHPVFFLGNTGHELDNFGVRAYLAQDFDLRPRAVVDLGASLGAGAPGPDGRLTLVTRSAASNPAFDEVARLSRDLAAGRFRPVAAFPGEGAEWAAFLGSGVPLLSSAGSFRQFHTPDDVPQNVTSPELLEQAYGALRTGVGDLLAAT
jgi:hypothetical protein